MTYYSIDEILKKAKQLLGKSINELFDRDKIEAITKEYLNNNTRRKGRLGQIIEKEFFKINPGITSNPDFKELNLELKVTPLKLTKNGLSAKERLVLSMIDYLEIINEEFRNSKFIKKK